VADDLVMFGSLSARQVSAVLRQGNDIPDPVLPVPVGETEVVGKIIGIRNGKILVQCRGYRVWVLMPPGLRSQHVIVGTKVRFIADLEVSERDDRFLIGSHAQGGEIID
jgi:hypothetical protein